MEIAEKKYGTTRVLASGCVWTAAPEQPKLIFRYHDGEDDG